MSKQTEEKIIDFIKKDVLTKDESLELIDSLYWADWDLINREYQESIDDIFQHLSKEGLSNEEVSLILKLYNNPNGAYVNEFANVIVNLYKKDKTKFIQSLNLEKEESINLVYIFRTHYIKLDEDQELLDIINSGELSEEEIDTAEKFIKMYENICNTWV